MNSCYKSPKASTSTAERSSSPDPDSVDWSQYGFNLRYRSSALSTSAHTSSPSLSVLDFESTATGSTSVYDKYELGDPPEQSITYSPRRGPTALAGPWSDPEVEAALREADEAWYDQHKEEAGVVSRPGPLEALHGVVGPYTGAAHCPTASEGAVRPSFSAATHFVDEQWKENIPALDVPSTAAPQSFTTTNLKPSRRANKRKRHEQDDESSAQPAASDTGAPAKKRTRRMKKILADVPPGLEHVAPPQAGEQSSAPPAPRRRQRRKASELQAPEVKGTRTCGLGGCKQKVEGSQREARAHTRSHYADLIEALKRSEQSESEQPKKLFFCSYVMPSGAECGEGGYTGVDGVQRHIEDVHWGWMFACPSCGKKFSRRDVMERHRHGCQDGQDE
ncbi:hypothetical protein C8Q78DRAFT_989133 [Trametes maxima]|nr:hypothetical protein C8Q78DRAFT_989133 [Trametes maxima]